MDSTAEQRILNTLTPNANATSSAGQGQGSINNEDEKMSKKMNSICINKQIIPITMNSGGGVGVRWWKDWSAYVVFIVGPLKEKMLGLKSQLLSKSPAFQEIVNAGKDVLHPEYNPSSFHIFLKYINTDNLCFAESHVCDLLRLAFVYEIPHIINKCREFAIATLSLENVLKYHLAASLYELEDLQVYAFKFMVRQGSVFLNHPSFIELDAITLGSLIGRDDFQVLETDLFRRLLDWVDAECHRLHYPTDKVEFHRRVCGNLFQHVRFALMTPKEFRMIVIPSGILNERDIAAIKLRQVTNFHLWSTLAPTQYVDRPRLVRPMIRVPLYKELQVSLRRYATPYLKQSFRFLVSSDIYLVGLEFFGPVGYGPLTSYRIRYLLENEWMTPYWKSRIETLNVITPHDFEVELPHPYKINSQFPYKLTVWMEGEITQFGSNPLPQAFVMLNNSHVCIHISDQRTDLPGRNVFGATTESLGIVKTLLFQPKD